MSVLLLLPEIPEYDLMRGKFAEALNVRDQEEYFIWPETGPLEDIEAVLCWHPPEGFLAGLPNLKLITSSGAGIDHLLKDPALPADVPVCRFINTRFALEMAKHVCGVILSRQHRLLDYREYQAARHWQQRFPRAGQNITVLGMGNLGLATAKQLQLLGYNVTGWSRSAKELDDITHLHGQDQLNDAVADADYVVCLLPLTSSTKGILNKNLFKHMQKGAYLVNVGRGSHLVEEDLLDALGQGHLGGAALDVFETEPLPEDHYFWSHPAIFITPHIASLTLPDEMIGQFMDNLTRLKNNQPLINQVDITNEY